MKINYEKERCECCNQTTTYLLPLDRGTADIVKAIAVAIGRKGINSIHPRKEMESPKKFASPLDGTLTSNQVGNLSRPRFHGLIAKTKEKNYCLTSKGAAFLRGEEVPRYAIISKAEKKQIGYFESENCKTTIKQIPGGQYWEGINYEIIEGKVVRETQPNLL